FFEAILAVEELSRADASAGVVVDQGVLHVDNDPGRGVGAGKFLDREDGFEEFTAATTILLGNLNSHQAQVEELLNQILVENALLVHFLGERTNALFGELADVIAKQDFVFSERSQRGRISDGNNGFRHTNTFESRMANLQF